MKIKLFQVGSLLFFSYKTNQEMTAAQLYLFTEDFKERANEYLKRYGIFEHYKDIDLRLYIGNSRPDNFSSRVMKSVKHFESKCLILGLIDYINTNHPDIAAINGLISILNKPTRVINAAVKAAILNEFCTVETT